MQSCSENLAPTVLARLAKEMQSLAKSSPDGVKTVFNEDDVTDIQADITGPAGSPFEGGVFRVRVFLGPEFPQKAPKAYFLTKIFHPNMSGDGEVCVDTLKSAWKPETSLRHIFMIIRCLLLDPFPESALNEEAAKMLLEDYDNYAKRARVMTGIYASGPKSEKSSSSELKVKRDTTGVTKRPRNKKKTLRRL